MTPDLQRAIHRLAARRRKARLLADTLAAAGATPYLAAHLPDAVWATTERLAGTNPASRSTRRMAAAMLRRIA